METTAQVKEIDFTRINNDVNGNPRFVCHFLNFINDQDRKMLFGFDVGYNLALSKAREIGGRKFHNKQYGGGIVFQMYDGEIPEMTERIRAIQNRTIKFKTEWTDKDFAKMHKAIAKHFSRQTVTTHKGVFYTANYKAVDELFGLAYTSSGVHACYSICNTEVKYDDVYDYQFFIMSEDGTPYAELWDKDENEKYIKL